MKKFQAGQRVKINAKGIKSRFGIIVERFENSPAYFIKVGCAEDRRPIWDIYCDTPCVVLLGEDYLEVIA